MEAKKLEWQGNNISANPDLYVDENENENEKVKVITILTDEESKFMDSIRIKFRQNDIYDTIKLFDNVSNHIKKNLIGNNELEELFSNIINYNLEKGYISDIPELLKLAEELNLTLNIEENLKINFANKVLENGYSHDFKTLQTLAEKFGIELSFDENILIKRTNKSIISGFGNSAWLLDSFKKLGINYPINPVMFNIGIKKVLLGREYRNFETGVEISLEQGVNIENGIQKGVEKAIKGKLVYPIINGINQAKELGYSIHYDKKEIIDLLKYILSIEDKERSFFDYLEFIKENNIGYSFDIEKNLAEGIDSLLFKGKIEKVFGKYGYLEKIKKLGYNIENIKEKISKEYDHFIYPYSPLISGFYICANKGKFKDIKLIENKVYEDIEHDKVIREGIFTNASKSFNEGIFSLLEWDSTKNKVSPNDIDLNGIDKENFEIGLELAKTFGIDINPGINRYLDTVFTNKDNNTNRDDINLETIINTIKKLKETNNLSRINLIISLKDPRWLKNLEHHNLRESLFKNQ